MNHSIPKELIESVQTDKLVIFVGAGISVKEGLPSWKDIVLGMLKEKKEYIENAEAFMLALTAGIVSPLEVLDKLEKEKNIFLIILKTLYQTRVEKVI